MERNPFCHNGYYSYSLLDEAPEQFLLQLQSQFSGDELVRALIEWGDRCPRDLDGLASRVLALTEQPVLSGSSDDNNINNINSKSARHSIEEFRRNAVRHQQLQLLLLRAKARSRPRVYGFEDAQAASVATVLERRTSWSEALSSRERTGELADALTREASHFYVRVSARQLLQKGRLPSKAPSAELCQKRYELLYGWALTVMFVATDDRDAAAKDLHRLADALVERHNYNDAAAVVNALLSSNAQRMGVAYVANNEGRALGTLKELFALKSNYAAYRARIGGLPDTARAIPLTLVHIHDLVVAMEVAAGDKEAMAFEATKSLGVTLERFLRFQRNWPINNSIPRLNLCSLSETVLGGSGLGELTHTQEAIDSTSESLNRRSSDGMSQPSSIFKSNRAKSLPGAGVFVNVAERRNLSFPEEESRKTLGFHFGRRKLSAPDAAERRESYDRRKLSAPEAAYDSSATLYDMPDDSDLRTSFLELTCCDIEPIEKVGRRLLATKHLFRTTVGGPFLPFVGDVETLVREGCMGVCETERALVLDLKRACGVVASGLVSHNALMRLGAFVLQLFISPGCTLSRKVILYISTSLDDGAELEIAQRFVHELDKVLSRKVERVVVAKPEETGWLREDYFHFTFAGPLEPDAASSSSSSLLSTASSSSNSTWLDSVERAISILKRSVIQSPFHSWPEPVLLERIPPEVGACRVLQTKRVSDRHFVLQTKDGDLPQGWNAVVLFAYVPLKGSDDNADLRTVHHCRDTFIGVLRGHMSSWNITSSLLRAIKDMDAQTSEFKRSGCSMAVALHSRDEQGNVTLVTANIGDARIELLSHGQSVRVMSAAHVGTDKDEAARVLQDGGSVIQGLVGGLVPVTRAIGLSVGRKYLGSEPHMQGPITLPVKVPTMLYLMSVSAELVADCGAYWSFLDYDVEVTELPRDADATVARLRLQ